MMKYYTYALLCLLPALPVQAQNAGADTLSLNSSWYFKTDPDNAGENKGWYQPAWNVAGWETMKVPGNWDTHNAYAHYAGKAWYRKQLHVPANWQGKRIRLQFEAVFHNSRVWLNGKLLGESHSGFLPFEFEVSEALNYGGANTVVVCADNSYRRGAIWNWGGIRRPVFLVAGNTVMAERQWIAPVVDLKNKTAGVTVKVLVKNTGTAAEEIRGEVVLTNTNGLHRVLPFTAAVPANGNKEVWVTTTLAGKDFHLWSFDDPYLYHSAINLYKGQNKVNALVNRFGLRKIELDTATYTFLLNGSPLRPMGFNLVPDDRTTGNTLPLWRIKEDIDLMKELGANMARLSHLPLPPEAMDYLDEKGILIFDEVSLWGLDPLADKQQPLPRQWLQQLMDRDYNHPCVIGWCVGNEISQYPTVLEYVKDAIDYVHRTDSLHLGVVVSHMSDRENDPIQYGDLGLINKYGASIGTLADRIHQLYPSKILFYTEYGYSQLGETLDTDAPAKAMLDSLRFKPYLIGGSLWTFNDYRSSYAGTKEYSENRSWGIVDVFRQKKRAYYSFRKEYAPVRDMQVKALGSTSATLVITPRQKLDLPAYTLRNYLAAWKAIDTAQRILDGGIVSLPVIQPGDAALSFPLQWVSKPAIAALHIELLSPLQYSVYDTLINLQKPAIPTVVYATGVRTEMNNLSANTGAMRIVFARHPFTKWYKIRYGKGSLTQETAPTVNHFADISHLAFNETYQYQIVAMNDAGETAAPVQTVKIGYGAAPPLMYYTEPADSGFFVGYASNADDHVYRIQYTASKGDYSNAHTLQSQTKGVLFVPGLENGRTYYFRMQLVKHNSYISEWSEEMAVTPDGGQLPPAPVVRGLLRNKTQALLFFTPVKKAIGYVVQYRQGSGEWKELQVNKGTAGVALLSGLSGGGELEFRIAAENSVGRSAFVDH